MKDEFNKMKSPTKSGILNNRLQEQRVTSSYLRKNSIKDSNRAELAIQNIRFQDSATTAVFDMNMLQDKFLSNMHNYKSLDKVKLRRYQTNNF